MKKTIKFDLPIDGVKVSTLDELRDHFTAEVVGHFRSGLLAKWLRSRRMTEQLDAVNALNANDDFTVLDGLCGIFDIEADAEAISAALAEPTGASLGDLAKAIEIPAELLMAYLEPSGSNQESKNRIISSKEKTALIRHLISPTLRNLRVTAPGERSEGKITNEGECEVWVFENPFPGRIVIQTQGELDTKGCLLDSFGNIIGSDDDSGDGLNFKMICEVHSGLYLALVSGVGSTTGGYSLAVHCTSDDSSYAQTLVANVQQMQNAILQTLGLGTGPLVAPPSWDVEVFQHLLRPLSIQLAELAKFREGIDG